MPIIEKVLAESDKQRIIRRVTTVEDTRQRSYRQHNATNKILSTVIITLTLITGFGIVGLAIFSINRRTKQIGTRRALGATKGQIMRYFMMENFIISAFARKGFAHVLVPEKGLPIFIARAGFGISHGPFIIKTAPSI